jgi:hypothetical protein
MEFSKAELKIELERIEALLARAGALAAAGAPGPNSDFTATTTNAVTTTIDTGYKPTSGNVAGIDGGLTVKDSAAKTGNKANIAGEIDNFAPAGLTIPQQPIVAGHRGDAGLSTCTVTYVVSPGGTLTVILTPPAGYVGTINWHIHQDYDEI